MPNQTIQATVVTLPSFPLKQAAVKPLTGGMLRSLAHLGPLVISFLLGAFLVASSTWSYRDGLLASRMVAEREGVAWLFRMRALIPEDTRDPALLAGALTAHRAFGLTYLGLIEHGRVIASAGVPLLPAAEPRVGSPAFGAGRLRLVTPGPGRVDSSPRPGSGAAASKGPAQLEYPTGVQSDLFPLPPLADRALAPSVELVAGKAMDLEIGIEHSRERLKPQLVIEFMPIGDKAIARRAFTMLLLSWGTALLLAATAAILWMTSRRADGAAKLLLVQSHLARLGEMSAVLAHEIRNPLAALKGHAQLLAERASEGPFRLRADRVVNEAIRLETLTNGLLQFAASGTINVGPTSPGQLLERAIAATDPGRVEWQTSSAPAVWHLDESRIEQVLVNLLDNALAVTPPHAKVMAAISVEEDRLVYAIRDHGPGLSPQERTRIFDAFYTTKIHGTGLGLSVSKRIIDLHRGSIAVEDATGGGALFRVVLPAPTQASP